MSKILKSEATKLINFYLKDNLTKKQTDVLHDLVKELKHGSSTF